MPPISGTTTYVDPTVDERTAADAFLTRGCLDPRIASRLARVVDAFGWAESSYIAEARAQGPASRIWDTTRWIVANALARARDDGPDSPER